MGVCEENEARRRVFCRPLSRLVADPGDEEPFFCALGTLWCTEGHEISADGGFEGEWVRIHGAVKPSDLPDYDYDDTRERESLTTFDIWDHGQLVGMVTRLNDQVDRRS